MFYHKSTKIRKILKQRMTKLIKENNCWLTTCTEPNISTGSTFQHNDHYTTPENQLNQRLKAIRSKLILSEMCSGTAPFEINKLQSSRL